MKYFKFINWVENKIKAFSKLEAPASVTEIKYILGIIQYLSRFIPELVTIMTPMLELIKKKKEKKTCIYGLGLGPTTAECLWRSQRALDCSASFNILWPNEKKIVLSAEANSFRERRKC